jgi:hypothetical protein
MDKDAVLRQHVLNLLRGGQASMTFDEAVANFPVDRINERPPNVPYTPWHLLEHMRIAQWDILDFCRNPNYTELKWPDEHWPAPDATADEAAWNETLRAFRADFAAVCALIADPNTDLYAKIPHGDGQTYLREGLLVADHNAYHTGEFAILRQVMGTWPEKR